MSLRKSRASFIDVCVMAGVAVCGVGKLLVFLGHVPLRHWPLAAWFYIYLCYVSFDLTMNPDFRRHLSSDNRWGKWLAKFDLRICSPNEPQSLLVSINRFFQYAMCFERSIVLFVALRALGFRPTLRIGIGKNTAGLTAHAWVKCDGLISGDEAAGQVFRPISAFCWGDE